MEVKKKKSLVPKAHKAAPLPHCTAIFFYNFVLLIIIEKTQFVRGFMLSVHQLYLVFHTLS